MIKNERQLALTRSQLQRFRQSRERLASQPTPKTHHPLRRNLELRALEAQADELDKQIVEYEALRSGVVAPELPRDLTGLPTALVRARIARGFTQKDLADRLGLKEQQIQRYEASDYAGASLSRLQEIAAALELTLDLPKFETAEVPAIMRNLTAIGLEREFIERRIYGPELKSAGNISALLELAGRLSRVFGWSASAVLQGPLQFAPAYAAVSFKVPKDVNEPKLLAYTHYARFLALLVLQAAKNLPRKHELPQDARALRALIERSHGRVTFKTTLKTIWDCGIAVLPLMDPGAFHAAFWKDRGKGVIVLKQGNRVSGRWLFDLLHETGHAVQRRDQADADVIELIENSVAKRYSEEELSASAFAADVLLDGKADALAQQAVTRAGGQIPRLKRAVAAVAREHGLPVEALAFHIAHRLSSENNYNWWGTATALAEPSDDWQIARDELLGRIDFGSFAEIDRTLLLKALQD